MRDVSGALSVIFLCCHPLCFKPRMFRDSFDLVIGWLVG